jgi:crotonobetainyl-CoA:carnitine CoA-transferase CaiB-like acyl-CoA transferase
MGRVPNAPLSGLRVVAFQPEVPARFAGKWLAALGAEVFQVEAPGGEGAPHADPLDDAASARHLYLDTGKKSAAFELSHPAERADLQRLVEASDLLLASMGPSALARLGLDLDVLREANPGLVSVSVLPFGETGPYAGLPATSLTLAALSGMLWHVGSPGRAPLAQWGDQPEHLGGLHTFGAVLSGLYGARASGRGEHLDISLQACCAAVVGHHTGRISQGGDAGPRRTPRALWRLYPTADGWAGISALARNYAGLATAMAVPEIAKASPFLDHHKHPEEEARLTELLEAWFASRTCKEVSDLALAERVPLASVLSIEQVAGSQHLGERGFFVDVESRAGHLRIPSRLWSSQGHGWLYEEAPQRGAHTHEARIPLSRPNKRQTHASERSGGLLSGVRVLDLGQVWAGPYASMLLGDHGADVIRVESPTAWDPNRCAAPPPGVRDADWWNTCPYYHEYNHNKRSLGLDLRTPRGRDLFAHLVAFSDVIIENLRVDVLERLGIGYEWLRAQRSDVILVSMTAFGRSGPESVLPGYGPMIEQLSGIGGLTGYDEDGPPQLANGYAYGDPVAAVAAASAALTALIQRQDTGAGQHIDLSQREVTTALLGEAFGIWSMTGQPPQRQGNGRRGCAPYGVYPCLGDDEWVAVAVTDDAQWMGLCAAMNDPLWSRDPDLAQAALRCVRRDELDARLGEWTAGQLKTDVFERCSAHRVPCGPVWSATELLEDPQLCAQHFYEWTSHPAVGRWRSHGWVWRPSGSGACLRRPAPDFGGDNDDVLRELLGLQRPEIEELEREGVVAHEPLGLPALPPD